MPSSLSPPKPLPFEPSAKGWNDRDACPVVDIGIELALVVHRLYPEKFKVEDMGRLLGDDETLNAIKSGESRAAIKARWATPAALFEERRRGALLY